MCCLLSFCFLPQALSAIPDHCFQRDTLKSLGYALISTTLTLFCGTVAAMTLPFQLSALPLWIIYAIVTGTVATGCWVVAHECGHGAFSPPEEKRVQDVVGYVLHSALLVPYFSWQRSHAVHHKNTNHVTQGEGGRGNDGGGGRARA